MPLDQELEEILSSYTLYTTSTCTRCPLARGSLDRAGVKWHELVLDKPENAEVLDVIRERLKADGKRTEVPILEGPDGTLYTNLATISGHLLSVRISS